jgi:CheY-like chemotaxis protein
MAQTVTPFLLDRGHRVYVATSYEQGVSFTREYRPDVVLIDARAEDPSALFAIRSIRASENPEMACTPIVAACGLLLPGYAERCKAAGVTELFERPMRVREMVAIVEEHGPYAKAC